jgi:hypothetical protein
MFKDLIKFTAKVAIVAAVVKFVILPNFPGLPNLADYLPSWKQVAQLALDPGNLFGKTQDVAHWAQARLPDIKINGTSLKPNLFPVDKVFNGESATDQAKHVLTGGIL